MITISVLRSFLIGKYLKTLLCSANQGKILTALHLQFAHETIFLTPSLIGSLNERFHFFDQSVGTHRVKTKDC